MNAIKATWKNGQIVPDGKVDWPEGCRLVVEPAAEEESFGIREDDWPDTPEAIADWRRWYDSLEPLIMTPKEKAKWQAALQEQKEYDKATFDKWAWKAEGLFP